MKKLPYGISNYEKLIVNNYYYVDKTMYIEKLEDIAETSIMFLRPRKFGKTLFTSTLAYYYDINEKDKFERLFGNTYIGKNPTSLKNSYHILRFNFSGIDTASVESTIKGFKSKTITSIELFVGTYGLDFFVDKDDEAENILYNLFKAFKLQKNGEKIYAIIDEYDHFANELLGFKTEDFKKLVSENGKVRKWYETLKEGTESVVDRIFITGVAPITLDSLTSGFNIGADKTRNEKFNEMLGFTTDELIKIMEEEEIDEETRNKLLPIMQENYDGYRFSIDGKEKIYNSNMCLYFLNEYIDMGRLPRSLIDVNIASDYSKLGNMLGLCKNESKLEILEKSISNEGIETEIIAKFNPEKAFEEREFISMLYYLGYLTMVGENFEKAVLKIPNRVVREIYADYFLKVINDETDLSISETEYNEITREVALEGKIDRIVAIVHRYLNNLSNRDYERFDEKYVKIIFYCIAMNIKVYSVRSEQENNRKYQDVLLIPRDASKNYQAVLVEFKYLKKEDEDKLEDMKEEARSQVIKYSKLEQISMIANLNKYTIVAVNDELYVEKVD